MGTERLHQKESGEGVANLVNNLSIDPYVESFPLTVALTTMDNRSYNSPLIINPAFNERYCNTMGNRSCNNPLSNKTPTLRTVPVRGN